MAIALYIEGRGALKRDLVACLRTGRALRVPRARSSNKPGAHVTADVVIGQRPAEAEGRAVPGHREGDLIIGLERSAIGTLVERTTRYTMLVHLPRAEGYGTTPRTKNGPALGGYGAVAMKEALAETMCTLPAHLRRSLTWDRGRELVQHAQFRVDTGIAVYFADPRSPWQRGTNENTNGLLRQYFPKGTDLARWSAEEIQAVAAALNSRPGRCSTRRPQQRHSMSSYDRSTRLVLLPPVESGQYASKEFADFCAARGVVRSLGRTGICYDNAVSESFFAPYKKGTRPHPSVARHRLPEQGHLRLDRNVLQHPSPALHPRIPHPGGIRARHQVNQPIGSLNPRS